MKFWKIILRIWITIVSVVSFMSGWIVLAHSPKPNQSPRQQAAETITLPPIPSLQEQIANSGQSLQVFSQPNTRRRILRTSAS